MKTLEQMGFKKGDKVRYRDNIWTFEGQGPSRISCFISHGNHTLFVVIDELKPIKSAHDKLIDMGYEYKEVENKVIFENGDDAIAFDKALGGWSIFNSTFDDTFIKSELIKIMAQYLEEMEEKK